MEEGALNFSHFYRTDTEQASLPSHLVPLCRTPLV